MNPLLNQDTLHEIMKYLTVGECNVLRMVSRWHRDRIALSYPVEKFVDYIAKSGLHLMNKIYTLDSKYDKEEVSKLPVIDFFDQRVTVDVLKQARLYDGAVIFMDQIMHGEFDDEFLKPDYSCVPSGDHTDVNFSLYKVVRDGPLFLANFFYYMCHASEYGMIRRAAISSGVDYVLDWAEQTVGMEPGEGERANESSSSGEDEYEDLFHEETMYENMLLWMYSGYYQHR